MTVMQKKADNPDRPPDRRGHREPRPGARRDPRAGHRQPRRARRGVHPQGHRHPAQARARQPRRAARLAVPAGVDRRHRRPLVAKILENMEIGHNIMHGQWDWMRDPKIHSTTWEWDNVSPSEQWKHSHNELHHTYTNVLGKDNDLGYGIMRVDEDQRWRPFYLAPAAVELHQRLLLRVRHRRLRPRDRQEPRDEEAPQGPASSGARPSRCGARSASRSRRTTSCTRCCRARRALTTLAANFTANLVRNLWTHSVIMCGHFPEGVETFERRSIVGETRGEWYLRQMLGSANISGSKAMHIMTGNLSFQIEHHLFPDLPSNRYQEIAPKVQDAVRALRPHLRHRPAAQAGRLGVAQGRSGCRCPTVAWASWLSTSASGSPRSSPAGASSRPPEAGTQSPLRICSRSSESRSTPVCGSVSGER